MARVVHFELPADKVLRAVAFYREVFGWRIEKWDGPVEYWLITTGPEGTPGIDGALMPREGPGSTVVNTVDVDDLDGYIAKVTTAGGTIVMPRMAVPGVGYMAYGQDTEGNTFGMMQSDPEAK